MAQQQQSDSQSQRMRHPPLTTSVSSQNQSQNLKHQPSASAYFHEPHLVQGHPSQHRGMEQPLTSQQQQTAPSPGMYTSNLSEQLQVRRNSAHSETAHHHNVEYPSPQPRLHAPQTDPMVQASAYNLPLSRPALLSSARSMPMPVPNPMHNRTQDWPPSFFTPAQGRQVTHTPQQGMQEISPVRATSAQPATHLQLSPFAKTNAMTSGHFYRDPAPSPSSRSSSSSDVDSEQSWYYNKHASPLTRHSPADSFTLESQPGSATVESHAYSDKQSLHPLLTSHRDSHSSFSSTGSNPTSPMNILPRSLSTASLHGVHQQSLLDDLDPTPRANYNLYNTPRTPQNNKSQQNNPYATPYNASYSEEPPNFVASQQSHPESSFTQTPFISPAASASSLPELSHRSSPPEDTFWSDMQQFNLDSATPYTPAPYPSYGGHESQQQALTMSDPSGLERGLPYSASADDLNEGISGQRRASMGPPISREPLHWQSQTTTATKQAAIARRKPGTAADFICPYCNESFTRRYNLKGHVRAHFNERPFACDQPNCGKAFARAHDLKRHKELHNTGNRYKCQNCSKRFKRIDALQKHYKAEQDAADADGRPDLHCYDPASTLESADYTNWQSNATSQNTSSSNSWDEPLLASPYSEDGSLPHADGQQSPSLQLGSS